MTAFFWLINIAATTLCETFDFISQTLNLGYVVGIAVTGALLMVLSFRIRALRFHPALFWAAIVGTTRAGISDLMDRTFQVGYPRGSLILTARLLAMLAVWYRRQGNLSADPIARGRPEVMFWIAMVFSNALGTAFGDFLRRCRGRPRPERQKTGRRVLPA